MHQDTYRLSIKGFDPVSEVIADCRMAKPVTGAPVVATANIPGVGAGVWRYIWTGTTVRKPTSVESYLFR
mgnify:CR=1 FL=1